MLGDVSQTRFILRKLISLSMSIYLITLTGIVKGCPLHPNWVRSTTAVNNETHRVSVRERLRKYTSKWCCGWRIGSDGDGLPSQESIGRAACQSVLVDSVRVHLFIWNILSASVFAIFACLPVMIFSEVRYGTAISFSPDQSRITCLPSHHAFLRGWGLFVAFLFRFVWVPSFAQVRAIRINYSI